MIHDSSPLHLSRRTGFSLVELLVVIAVLAVLSGIVVVAVNGGVREANLVKSLGNLRAIGVGVGNYVADNGGRYPLLTDDWGAPYWTQSVSPYLADYTRGDWRDLRGNEYSIAPVYVSPLIENGRHHRLGDYGGSNKVFPMGLSQQSIDSGAIQKLVRVTDIVEPNRTVMVCSAQIDSSAYGVIPSWYIAATQYVQSPGDTSYAGPSDWGTGRVQALFCDGHTEAIPVELFEERREDYLYPDP